MSVSGRRRRQRSWFKKPVILCIACGQEGNHFIPNYADHMGGWFTCWDERTLTSYRKMWDLDGFIDYRF